MNDATIPVCVDLDGTLLASDSLWENLVVVLRHQPWTLLRAVGWLAGGKAHFKRKLAEVASLDVATLPYRAELVEFLRSERARGRRVILTTGADAHIAEAVASHLGLFDEVIASDGVRNLSGAGKAEALVGRFGAKQFDYAGNSNVDLPVWAQARAALVVASDDQLTARVQSVVPVARVFRVAGFGLGPLLRAMRSHQWAKNLIVFVPLLTAHQLENASSLRVAGLAFIAFCLGASGVYMLNDLLDVDADRRHARKQRRPFASGALSLAAGFLLAPVLLLAAAVVAWFLPGRFLLVLGGYFALTTAYSWWIKRAPLLDVFCLAGLYTLRLVGGHEATGIVYSAWLLVFSLFIFLSLALAKRFQELHRLRREQQSHAHGRGYTADDLELVASLGSSSGYLAVLVLALYVNSEQVRTLYHHPLRLLLVCPLLLYWISRVWLLAHRGQLHDDPVLFAVRDRVSYLTGAAVLAVIWLSAIR